MDFKQLESFVAVVDYGSFTKAAEKLFISQPTISTHIRMLEEEFQSCLLDRTTKSINLTPRGREFYTCASNILAIRNHLTKSWVEESRKMIHLGASTIPSTYILPEVLPAYLAGHPDIHFNIHQSDSQGILDGVLSGSFHLGLIGMPCDNPSITCTPFLEDHMVMITPNTEHFRACKEAGTQPVTLMTREPMILRELGSGSRKCADQVLEELGLEEGRLDVIARLNDQESIKNLVAQGLGISIISEKAARCVSEDHRLLIWPLPSCGATRKLYVIHHKSFILKPHALQFIEFLTEFYQ